MKTAKDFMSTPALTIDANASIRDAAILMKKKNVSSLIVLKDMPFGIVTERDFVHKFCIQNKTTENEKIINICSKKLISVSSDDDIRKISKMFDKKNIRHIVVKDDGVVKGLITIRDLLDKIF